MAKPVLKPFPYFGGKSALAPTLVSLLPQHMVYVEVFGGSGAVLFAKPPSKVEVFNDLDSGVVNFFRVLRNTRQAARLQRLLALTPYAREEYDACWETWRATRDPVERARRWYVSIAQAFTKRTGGSNPGWGVTGIVDRGHPQQFSNHVAELLGCAERFRNVYVEHADFAKVFAAHDGPNTLFYCDPPYLPTTRKAGGARGDYAHEMTQEEHVRFLVGVTALQGMVMVSGYPSALYDDALVGWERLTKRQVCKSAGHTRKSGLQGVGKVTTQQQREEVIWLNPACVRRQASLWQGMEAIS